ncbi:hypothetical protein BCV72DRAFT_265106 [Rhizopus microsporus var. microsporus]|uniref:DDT domain-containing protein n=2 Tax=Rhizopus microsporus TaxID=58291 RepID=A0A2G4SFY7_RHIZD|nr:uncharacterized protein RHIMIDRAFT_316565 [Rhizopus microsporus ATCC 52813]ORE02591.1 hypothetical protein BCV72DRAFT_265106 [Rhizopus microsporus var. microsporus]PHZ07683.1 hypothetical protein RHIMIDRAFT_316565 [Rhizopus microsporus ATCC 52813]
MPARKTNKELPRKEESNDLKGLNKTNRSSSKDKLTISVTENSSPEQILRSSWLFLSTFQFFFLFQDYFELSSLNIEQLENAMMQQESNEFLKQFMCHVLTPLLSSNQRRAINPDNYEQYLFTLFPEFGPKFQKLHVVDRIQLLKRIEEAHLENNSEDFLAWKNSMDVNELRVAPLGKDDAGWNYWYFGDTRLYREIPVSNGKKGLKEITNNQFTFELVCSNLEDWERIVESFRTAKRKARELSEKIIELGEEMIARIKSREAAKLKQEARLKRAKELEQIPKKRSRRLEAKYEEEAKRQKVEEIASQQAILEEIERQKRVREAKQQREEEQRQYRTEDARLKMDVSNYIKQKMNEAEEDDERLEYKQLKNQLHKDASRQEKLKKMRGWLKLLKEDEEISISLKVDKEKQITFEGDNKDQADESFTEVYKKLLLNKYRSLKDFCADMNELEDHDTSFLVSAWKDK